MPTSFFCMQKPNSVYRRNWVATLSLDPAASLTKPRSKHFSRKVHISPTNSIYTKSTSRRVWTVKKPYLRDFWELPHLPPISSSQRHSKIPSSGIGSWMVESWLLPPREVWQVLPAESLLRWTWKSLISSEMIHIRWWLNPTHVKNYAKNQIGSIWPQEVPGEK